MDKGKARLRLPWKSLICQRVHQKHFGRGRRVSSAEQAFPGVGHRLRIPLSLFMTNGKGIGTEIGIGIEIETGTDQLQRHSYWALHPIPYLLRLLPDTTGPMVI